MRKKKYSIEEEVGADNPFAQSTGDLMAGLMFIFVLLLTGMMLRVQERAERDDQIAKQYELVKTQLFIDLEKEFKDDLKVWNAEIDSTNLSIRFQEPSTLFDYDRAELKDKFVLILDDFFPRYIGLLHNEKYRKSIEEIRIEGHTDSQGSYIYNMQLSQNRTRAVLAHCMELMNDTIQPWCIKRITANGLSSSHTLQNEDGSENSRLSRRVEFRIRTNAEKQIEMIQQTHKQL